MTTTLTGATLRACRLLVCVPGLLGTAGFAAAGDVSLRLDAVRLEGGEFRFELTSTQPADPERLRVLGAGGDQIQVGRAGRWTVYADLERVHVDKWGSFFHYELTAVPDGIRSASPTRFSFKGTPVGRFLPRQHSVAFAVGVDAPSEWGAIELPILSFDSEQYVSAPELKTPFEVRLIGETEIPIPIKNRLNLPVRVRRR